MEPVSKPVGLAVMKDDNGWELAPRAHVVGILFDGGLIDRLSSLNGVIDGDLVEWQLLAFGSYRKVAPAPK